MATTDGQWGTLQPFGLSSGGKWYCESKLTDDATASGSYQVGLTNNNDSTVIYW